MGYCYIDSRTQSLSIIHVLIDKGSVVYQRTDWRIYKMFIIKINLVSRFYE